MSTYKISVSDRKYTNWEVFDTLNFAKINLDINPFISKLFSNDVFKMVGSNTNIIHSSIRCSSIPGVLVLAGSKTYGRHKTNDKLLYKCIPDDMRLPSFLVPYKIKTIGFSKVYTNLYVTILFDEWNDKHPHGKLENVIGSVDVLDNYYEYQLYCKSLNASIQKFHKDTTKSLEKCHEEIFVTIKKKYPSIQDRTEQNIWKIITIDPPKSMDYDDGFGIIEHPDNLKQLSIYISNVTIWMDVLDLWNSFSQRISTIYLPDKKRPMLPTILSDCLCSLQENVVRVALTMDIFIQNNEIIDIQFNNSLIKVIKNYCYEEPSLLADTNYNQILNVVKQLSNKKSYINNVKNSHDVVCYLMILMNYHSAKEMLKHNTGIFRTTIIKKGIHIPTTVPDEVSNFIKIWNSSAGQYIDGSEISDTRHENLDLEAYIHITSPIRRLVDLLNIIKFQHIKGTTLLSENANKFYDKWLKDIEYINITMRAIRKVQCNCTLLDLCNNNNEIMNEEYDGYLFDKITRNDELYQFNVFLPKLKLMSKITIRDNLDNFACKKFKLYLFNDEENFKRKIRVHLL